MSSGLRESAIEPALGRAVLLFRFLAVVWMAVMVVINLISDGQSRTFVVVGALALAVGGAIWSYRHLIATPPVSNRFLIIDAVIATLIAISPQVAGAADGFYGGYPMSTVVVIASALGVGWGLGAAGVFVATQAAALVLGARSAPSAADLVSLTVMATIVTLVVSLGFEFVKSAERRRIRAEEALEEERRRHEVEAARLEERVALADDLHDSLLQTVRVIGTHAQDPARVRTLARRQEKELVAMIERMHGGASVGAAAQLRTEAADVEELFGVPVEVVSSGDAPFEGAVVDLVRSAREMMVNAARHSGADRIDVTLEVSRLTVTAVVRDRGVGYDTDSAPSGHGLTSVRTRLANLGGEVQVASAPGEGTEVELTVPREAE